MPRFVDSPSRADMLAWMIIQLLAEEGISALTMRRIADASRLSTSSLVHHFRSKDQMLRAACGRTAEWRASDITHRRPLQGIAAFLPDPTDRSSMVLAKAWVGWRELWRTGPFLDRVGTRARWEERWVFGEALAEMHGADLDEQQLHAAYALLEGLVVAMCLPLGTMRREDAVAVLESQLALLLGPAGGTTVA